MKKILFTFLILLISFSCVKDDSENVCSVDCTLFTGRILAAGDIGIENAEIRLYYNKRGTLGSFTRIIANGKSDNKGFYKLSAFLEDRELMNDGGKLYLEINKDILSAVTPSTHLEANQVLSTNPNIEFSGFSRRDTIVEHNFIVPKKTALTINLREFRPIISGDYFRAGVGSNFGRQNSDWFYIVIGEGMSGEAQQNTNPTVLNFNILQNDTVYINTLIKKDGVEERTLNKIFIENPTTEIDYYY